MPYKNKKDQQAYQKKVEKKYTITLSRVSEKDIIEYIDSHKPCNAFIKSLVKKDMQD